MTCGNPSVVKALPSIDTPTLPHTSLARNRPSGCPCCRTACATRRARPRPRADDVDHAAHRVVAVDAGAGAVHHLHPVHVVERHARPVHPAAERIVERHAVDQHQRPAHAARPDAAQRHALRRGVGRQAAGPAEQAEGGHQAQHVVGHRGGRLANLLRLTTVTLAGTSPSRCSVRVGVTVTDSRRPAGSSTISRGPLGVRGWLLRESTCPHDKRGTAGRSTVQAESAVRAGHLLVTRPARQ